MVAKKYIVRSFFEKSVYLKNNVNIELRKDIVADFVGNIEGLRILDIGCGNAFLHAHRQSWIFRPTGKLDRIDHVLCVDRTCFNWDRSGRSKSVMEER